MLSIHLVSQVSRIITQINGVGPTTDTAVTIFVPQVSSAGAHGPDL